MPLKEQSRILTGSFRVSSVGFRVSSVGCQVGADAAYGWKVE
jgi:hypothetical protein